MNYKLSEKVNPSMEDWKSKGFKILFDDVPEANFDKGYAVLKVIVLYSM